MRVNEMKHHTAVSLCHNNRCDKPFCELRTRDIYQHVNLCVKHNKEYTIWCKIMPVTFIYKERRHQTMDNMWDRRVLLT